MSDALVSEIMRRDVPTVAPNASIGSVARVLSSTDLPGVPVVNAEGEIVGIITEGDLIARESDVEVPTPLAFLDGIFQLDGGRDFDEELRHVLAVTADQLMTHPVFNIKESATITQLATLMLDENINPVPVVNDYFELVGIVSRADIVRIIAKLERDDSPVPAAE
jgi:CBS domain-containing protein